MIERTEGERASGKINGAMVGKRVKAWRRRGGRGKKDLERSLSDRLKLRGESGGRREVSQMRVHVR